MNKVRKIIMSTAAATIMAIGCVGGVTASAATSTSVKSNIYVKTSTVQTVTAIKTTNSAAQKKTLGSAGNVTVTTSWKLSNVKGASRSVNPEKYLVTMKFYNSKGQRVSTQTIKVDPKKATTTNKGYKSYTLNIPYERFTYANKVSLPTKVNVSVKSIAPQGKINTQNFAATKTVNVKQSYNCTIPQLKR